MCPASRACQWWLLRVSRWGLIGAVLGHLPGLVKATEMTRGWVGSAIIDHGIRAERETRRRGPWASEPNRPGPGPTRAASQDGVNGSGFSWHFRSGT
ncbi:hypothetical protein QBC39DRAFT_346776, partial [Podospora conica]